METRQSRGEESVCPRLAPVLAEAGGPGRPPPGAYSSPPGSRTTGGRWMK